MSGLGKAPVLMLLWVSTMPITQLWINMYGMKTHVEPAELTAHQQGSQLSAQESGASAQESWNSGLFP